MSTVGRIFLVLNLVLTFVLCGFVGAYLYSASSYRVAYEKIQTTAATEVTSAEQERDTFKNEKVRLETENKMLRQQVSDLSQGHNLVWRSYVAERASMATLEGKFTDLAARLDGWDGIYRDLTDKIGEYNGELSTLKEAQTRSAEDQRLARNREVAAAASLIRSENQGDAMRGQISELLGSLDERDATIAVYTRLYGPLGSSVPPPNLVGRVVNTASDGSLMTVELSGLVDREPMIGWQLALFSDTEFKGFVSISETHGGGRVTCRLVWGTDGASTPSMGDRVKAFAL